MVINAQVQIIFYQQKVLENIQVVYLLENLSKHLASKEWVKKQRKKWEQLVLEFLDTRAWKRTLEQVMLD